MSKHDLPKFCPVCDRPMANPAVLSLLSFIAIEGVFVSPACSFPCAVIVAKDLVVKLEEFAADPLAVADQEVALRRAAGALPS